MASASLAAITPSHSQVIDGFVAYCVSNRDGTGICTNTESGAPLNCQIIPGVTIDCKSPIGRAFECVWISDIVAGSQANFWCSADAERILLSQATSSRLSTQSNSIIDGNEFIPDELDENHLPEVIKKSFEDL